MEYESKKAAKAFVDQYFPVKKANNKPTDIWAELLKPNSKESFKMAGYHHGNGSNSLNFHSGISDGKQYGNTEKGQSIAQNGNNPSEHCEISEPCLMSSSVDYGCRDNYPYTPSNSTNIPYNPDCRYPGPSSYNESKDKISEAQGGAEWWQGSFYY